MTTLIIIASRRRCCLITVAFGGIALLGLAGCAKKNEPIVASGNILKGKVTLDNQPVKIGMVCAWDEKGTEVGQAPIGPDGAYSLQQLPEGKLQLAVIPPPMMGPLKLGGGQPPPNDLKDAPPHLKGPEGEDPKFRELLASIENMPSKYSSPRTSELATTIKGEITEFNIKLSK